MIIFDTNIVTMLSYGNARIQTKMDAVEEGEVLAITVITQMEILKGRFDAILKAANETELLAAMTRFRTSRDFLTMFELVEISTESSQHFEQLRKLKKLAKVGRPDLLIASIARANQALLVTRNTKDFKDVPGLQIANWVDT